MIIMNKMENKFLGNFNIFLFADMLKKQLEAAECLPNSFHHPLNSVSIHNQTTFSVVGDL